MKKAYYKRKRLYFLITLFLVLSGFFYTPSINAIGDLPVIPGAHRGSSVEKVENTFEAIEMAVNDENYAFIEFDVQYTKDKQIVVFHDLSLFRFQKQFYKVGDLTYDQLVKISRYNVPLYEEVMDLIGDEKKVNIEIKSQGNLEDDKEIIEFIIEDSQERGISESILFSSISKDVIKYIKDTHPELKVGQIFLTMTATYFNMDYFTESFYQDVEETGADYLMLHGINIRNIQSLVKLKPADKTLVFWYFDNQMYVVDEEGQDSWLEV
jgi:glycerophosphoryl diester phosphodiesterase